MTLDVGDLVRLTISGTDADNIRGTLESVVPAVAPNLLPIDEQARPREHFDLFSLGMDFVVATAAGLSVEGIRALIVECLGRRPRGLDRIAEDNDKAPDLAKGKDASEVLIQISADGVIEITIQVR